MTQKDNPKVKIELAMEDDDSIDGKNVFKVTSVRKN